MERRTPGGLVIENRQVDSCDLTQIVFQRIGFARELEREIRKCIRHFTACPGLDGQERLTAPAAILAQTDSLTVLRK
jgi:hypothetical protein